MRRLLITGVSGTLGRNLTLAASQQGWEVYGTYYTSPPPLSGHWFQLDVGDREAVIATVRRIRPTVVVHTAFRQHGETMWATTAVGPAFVAQATQEVGAHLIHVSSDAVFDGTDNPYTEEARPRPSTLYGAAKAAAEMAVSAIAPQAAIVRTALIISREPLDPHTRFTLDLAAGRRSGHLFRNQYRCPIGADDLAGAIMELAVNTFTGVIHVACADAVTRYDLGRMVARAYGIEMARLPAAPIPAELASTVIADIRLDSIVARTLLKTRLRGMYEWFDTAP